MRKDCPFVYENALEMLHGNKICLNNIRGWQAHISHFLSDKHYTKHSSVLSFSETKVNGSRISSILEHQPGWESTDLSKARHGLEICYNESKVVID